MARLPSILAPLVVVACSGSGSSGGASARGHIPDDARAADAEAVVAVAIRPLGKASLDEYSWRRGPGKVAFDRALAAERKGDLAAVERASAAALAADPGHLEAAWMLAVARVRLDKLDQVLAPLEIAAAGDWGKWGERSLSLPVFEPFRASPAGRGWVRAAEQYRAAVAGALVDAVVVVGRSQPFRAPRGHGDLTIEQRAEAYAVAGDRWLRLTRTGGALAGALTAPGRGAMAYAAYREVVRPASGKARIHELRIGVVDLGTGVSGRELVLTDVVQATLAWASGTGRPTLVIELTPVQGKPQVFALDPDTGARRPRTAGLPRAESLRIRPLDAERRRLAASGLTADWDEQGTASAVRLDRSRKIVTPPAGAMIDGHSLAWSPDQARLAFASVAADPCGDAAARRVTLYVVDAGSGRLRSVADGDRVPSPVWYGTDRLGFVDGDEVRVIDAASGNDVQRLGGGGGVTTGVLGEQRPCAASEVGPFAGTGAGSEAGDPDSASEDEREPEVDELAPGPPPVSVDAGVGDGGQRADATPASP